MFLQKQTRLQKIFIYIDASFDPASTLAVAGCLFFDNEASNARSEVNDSNIETHSFKAKNNIRAEIIGANYFLKKLSQEIQLKDIDPKNLEVHLYSDCQTITELSRRRDKLQATEFISGAKQTPLANTDLYKEFYEIFDVVQPKIHWVKGHSPSKDQSLEQKNFQIIDQKVRQQLRLI